VIVISAQNTIMTAIQAAEAEAFDYLPKPFDLPDLMKRTARALDQRGQAPRVMDAPARGDASDELPLVGRTPVMQTLYRLIAGVMNTDLPVLITGESGTGKSLIAKALHDLSDRRNLPFISVTAADLTDLDGPAKVLARAKGGTVLVDEIADVSSEVQARIVRMMDAPGDHAPRFVASSQFDPTTLMESGKVRQDLFYRLDGAAIAVPALRERVDDIPLLAEHFLARAEREGAPKRVLSQGAADLFRVYTWPGNVRQLENAVRRLGLTSRTEEISRTEVEAVLGNQPETGAVLRGDEGDRLGDSVARHLRRYFDLHGGMLPPAGLYGRIVREVEVPLIEIALEATGGNQAKCADLLGINRNTLRKKITELDIHVTRKRKLM
jgi:two-component system nitrogen regulation response regulator GlnG